MRPASTPLPPGPRQIASIVHFVRAPYEYLERCFRRYGEPFTLVMPPGSHPLVFVRHPDHVKLVFGRKCEPEVSRYRQFQSPLLGDGSIVVLEGETHLELRRKLNPWFRRDWAGKLASEFADIAARRSVLWPETWTGPLLPRTQDVTMEIILRAIFGIRVEAGIDRAKRLFVDYANRVQHWTSFFPVLLRDIGPLSPGRRFQTRHREVREMIRREKSTRQRSSARGDDLMAFLLELLETHGPDGISDTSLEDQFITLLVAGQETTAKSLAWALLLIHLHPTVRNRLRDELGPPSAFDPAQCTELPYLDAVCRETLRLCPPAPVVERRLGVDVVIGRCCLPAGTEMAVAISSTHRDPTVYPEPERFRPERFLERKFATHEFVPFGGGVRTCLGMTFAMQELRVLLGYFLTHFEFAPTSRRLERGRLAGTTVGPSRGARMAVRRLRLSR